jgi:hypothetical protein
MAEELADADDEELFGLLDQRFGLGSGHEGNPLDHSNG